MVFKRIIWLNLYFCACVSNKITFIHVLLSPYSKKSNIFSGSAEVKKLLSCKLRLVHRKLRSQLVDYVSGVSYVHSGLVSTFVCSHLKTDNILSCFKLFLCEVSLVSICFFGSICARLYKTNQSISLT